MTDDSRLNLRSNDSNGETRSVESTGKPEPRYIGQILSRAHPKAITSKSGGIPIGGTIANWGNYISGALAGASTGENSKSNECSAESNIEDNRNKGEELDSTEKAGQDDSGDGVNDSNTRDALNCFPLLSNAEVVVG